MTTKNQRPRFHKISWDCMSDVTQQPNSCHSRLIAPSLNVFLHLYLLNSPSWLPPAQNLILYFFVNRNPAIPPVPILRHANKCPLASDPLRQLSDHYKVNDPHENAQKKCLKYRFSTCEHDYEGIKIETQHKCLQLEITRGGTVPFYRSVLCRFSEQRYPATSIRIALKLRHLKYV